MKKIILILVLHFTLITLHCYAQPYWVQHAGGITIDEGIDVATDANGNSYSTGTFTGAAAFGNTTLHSAGSTDIYIVKLNHLGVYNWVVRAGGGGTDRPTAIKADAVGNSYITGYFYGTAHFGTFTLTSAGIQDVFIAKYDSAGTCLWARSCGGAASDIGNGITVDNAGNVIVTGQFKDSALFGPFNLISMDSSVDVFTTKLDANGTFLWAKKGSGPYVDRGFKVVADAAGNIYVTGQFSDTVTFDVTHNNPMYNAIFLIKYDANGNEQWFRRAGGGGLDVPRGLVLDNAGNPVIAGDFQGSLTFFNAPTNSSMTDTYFNRIFVAKYDANGNKLWSAASSSDATLNLKDLAIDTSNNLYAIGDFSCRLNKYADVYGQGTFNSVGYSDIFVSKWDATGTWLWSRQIGGEGNDYGNGIAIDTTQNPIITGSYEFDLYIPARNNNFIMYNTSIGNWGCNTRYCGDNFYGMYAFFGSQTNNRDVFIGRAVDIARQPLDFYYRTDSVCNRIYKGVFLNSTGNSYAGQDSVDFCTYGRIYANTGNCNYSWNYSRFHFQWSTGDTTYYWINVYSTGWYSVTVTTRDGCFTSTDSIYVTLHNPPDPPAITDDHGFNNHAIGTTLIHTCKPDSVILLTGSNYVNCRYQWTGGPPNDSTLIVTHSGYYYFALIDSFGCQSYNTVQVIIDSLLPPIMPSFYCPQDTDRNDTISICMYPNYSFTMYVFDSLRNPNHNPNIYTQWLYYDPYASQPHDMFLWSVIPNTCTYIFYQTNSLFSNSFSPTSTGLYTITLTLIRANYCSSDTFVVTRSIYVILDTLPVAPNYNPSITGNPVFCPGDSTLLVAYGLPSYRWSYGSTNDSIYAHAAGTYMVWYNYTNTNSYGCRVQQQYLASISVSTTPQPYITMAPSSGLICPNDSVLITCTSTGSYAWQGPSGPLGGNTSFIYASEPGFYYCIFTDPDSCTLTTNEVEIIQYNTPYIQVTPDVLFCPGDSVLLSVISSPGSTIQWMGPLNGNNPNQYVHVGGTYSCSVTSCNITTIAYATIQESVPVAHITTNGPAILCAGDSLVLFGNLGNATYYWLPGGSSYPNDSITATGVYKLIIADPTGCTARDSITVVASDDTVTSSFTASPLTGCNPSTVTFSNGSYRATSCLWNFGDGDTSSLTNPTHTYTTSGTFSVTLIAYHTNSCGTFTDTVIIPNYITIYPFVTATFTPNIVTGCVPFLVNFTNTSTNATSFNWAFGDGNTSTSNSPSNTYNTAGIYTVTLIANGLGGCNDTAHLSYISAINAPVVTCAFIADTTHGCAPLTINFHNNSSGATNYLWNFGDTTISTLFSPNHTFLDSGLFTIKLTTVNDTSICGIISDSVTINHYIQISNPVKITSDFIASPVKGCTPLVVNINNKSSNGTAYIWRFGDGDSSLLQNPNTITYSAAGIYTITLISTHPDARCFNPPDTMRIEISADSCLISISNTFSPNGDGKNDYFNLIAEGCTDYHVLIFNRWGQKIFESYQNKLLWDGYDTSGNEVPDGTYFYILTAIDFNGSPFINKGAITLIR